MIKLLLIVIGCYMFAAAIVHIYYHFSSKETKKRHYILLANQQQESMEWYYRSMRSFSEWMGIPVQVTIVHAQPGGELLQMVDRWSRKNDDIVVKDRACGLLDQAIVIDLSKKDDLCKLPF